MLEAFLVSTALVALAEIGDKTQLLSLILAARFRRPWPIVAGIAVATLVNHLLAGALGGWLAQMVGPTILRWGLGLSFLVMAAWLLIPDRCEEDEVRFIRGGIFVATAVAFFLAEMGDKTQVATVGLAAHYHAIAAIVVGTTLGMLLANVPVVFFGEKLAARLPVKAVHALAAAVFAGMGGATLLGVGADYF
ncbi:MAG: TMEM165/GDT1 family protein [Rhodocyclaceae bacterium]|nr:TMEM165/GDT1 family protein [Rhodocyclaceae bacterium]